MNVVLRPAKPEDAEVCGRIVYEAFGKISNQHNFPPDWPSEEVSVGFLSGLISHPGFYGVVAEVDGRVAGSNFLDERSSVAGLGPITVDPELQNARVGRELMAHVLDRAWSSGRPGVRLVQAAYHGRSLSLYAKLGFDAREPLSCMQGMPLRRSLTGYPVRRATKGDVAACNELCRRVHGFERGRELEDAIAANTATVVEHESGITGFATMIGLGGYAVG